MAVKPNVRAAAQRRVVSTPVSKATSNKLQGGFSPVNKLAGKPQGKAMPAAGRPGAHAFSNRPGYNNGRPAGGSGGKPAQTRGKSNVPRGPFGAIQNGINRGGNQGGRGNGNGNKVKGPGKNNGTPSLSDYLGGDPSFQNTLDDLRGAFDMFMERNNDSRGDVNEMFKRALDRMNLDRDRAHEGITDDFGARGILNSGLFGKAISDYDTDFNNRASDLEYDRSETLGDLQFDRRGARQDFRVNKNNARLEAIRRRAAQYGIR